MVELTVRNPMRATFGQLPALFGPFTSFSSYSSGPSAPPGRNGSPRAEKLPEEDPLGSLEREVNNIFSNTIAEFTGAFGRGVEGIQSSISEVVADGIYKACLSECVDDQRHVWPRKLAACWINAKTDDDAESCIKMSNDLRRWKDLHGEIDRLENELKRLSSK